MNPLVLYLIVALTVFVAWLAGRSLDQQHSNDRVTWKTGVVGRKTVFQSVVLALVGGPIVWALKGMTDPLWFYMLCMAAAPFIVDILRPQVTLHSDTPAPVRAVIATKMNRLNLAGVIVGVILLSALVAYSAGAFTLPTPSGASCRTCSD